MVVVGLIDLTAFSIFNYYKSYYALVLISDRSLKKTNGNTHDTKQFGIILCFLAMTIYLNSFLALLNGESATITSAFPYNSALAAPILLPHKYTQYLFSLKKFDTTPICSDYFFPKVILSSSWLFPQPIKSKVASEKSFGKYFRYLVPSKQHDEFPCKYRIILLFFYLKSKIDKIIFLSLYCTIYYRFEISR